jgi:type III secretion protein L
MKSEDVATFFKTNEIFASLQDKARILNIAAKKRCQNRYEEGYLDGLQSGKMEHTRKIMDTVISSVEYLEHLEVSLARIVSEIVRKLIGEMPRGDMTVQLVRQALQVVKDERKVTIRVSLKDEVAVRRGMDGLLRQYGGAENSFLNVLADPSLQPGSCVLESEMGVIEASLETQLKNLENTLLARIRHASWKATT